MLEGKFSTQFFYQMIHFLHFLVNIVVVIASDVNVSVGNLFNVVLIFVDRFLTQIRT